MSPAVHSTILPQALQPSSKDSNASGEGAAADGRVGQEQNMSDSDSSGPSMGLLLGSVPVADETAAAGEGGKRGEKGMAQQKTANGRPVETDIYTNGPAEGASSSLGLDDLGNGLRNGLGKGEVAPGAPTGVDTRNGGNTDSSGSSIVNVNNGSRGGTLNSSSSSSNNNNNGTGGREGRKRGVEVSADNVWEAFLATRPSLSSEDRARYDSAYRKFRGGSRPADFNPISSMDDGTLRTALK